MTNVQKTIWNDKPRTIPCFQVSDQWCSINQSTLTHEASEDIKHGPQEGIKEDDCVLAVCHLHLCFADSLLEQDSTNIDQEKEKYNCPEKRTEASNDAIDHEQQLLENLQSQQSQEAHESREAGQSQEPAQCEVAKICNTISYDMNQHKVNECKRDKDEVEPIPKMVRTTYLRTPAFRDGFHD